MIYFRLFLSLFLLAVLSLNNLGIISLTHHDLVAIVSVNNAILIFFVIAAMTIMVSLNDTEKEILAEAVKKVEGASIIPTVFFTCLSAYLFYLKMTTMKEEIVALLPLFFLFVIHGTLSVVKRRLNTM